MNNEFAWCFTNPIQWSYVMLLSSSIKFIDKYREGTSDLSMKNFKGLRIRNIRISKMLHRFHGQYCIDGYFITAKKVFQCAEYQELFKIRWCWWYRHYFLWFLAAKLIQHCRVQRNGSANNTEGFANQKIISFRLLIERK